MSFSLYSSAPRGRVATREATCPLSPRSSDLRFLNKLQQMEYMMVFFTSSVLSLSQIADFPSSGLDIPHNVKRSVGFNKDKKELDVDVHRRYIFSGHVAAYMKTLMEDEPEKHQSHFIAYIKRGLEPDGLDEMYTKVQAAICANPTVQKSASRRKPPCLVYRL